jgi:hypothetical protein
MLNGISAAITAQDLVDRTISLELPALEERLETTTLWSAFEAQQGMILGGLLNVFVRALAILPNVQLPAAERPRLIEFALLGCAIAEAIGQKRSDFMEQFTASRVDAITRTLDDNPVAVTLQEFMIREGGRQVRIELKALMQRLSELKLEFCDALPKSPRQFGDALRRAAPALRQLGISCRSSKKVGGKIWWEIKELNPYPTRPESPTDEVK